MIRPKFAKRAAVALAAASLVLAGCATDGGNDPGDTERKGDGTLKIGSILPQTGSLAFLGPPEFAGIDLAIQDINAAGGVLGNDVVVEHKDSGDTTTDIASQAADALIAQGVDAIIGSASSSVSLAFIDKLYEAGIVQISPANTSPAFTDYAKGDYYFRTAPSDVLQGRVLGDLVLADGNAKVAILALQDSYGTGLADNVEKAVVNGGGEVVLKEIYDPNAAEFSSEVAAVKAADPDAVVLITFNEILKLAPALVEGGLGADVKDWYFVDGNLSNYSEDFPAGTLAGVKGTLPGAEVTSDFQARLEGVEGYELEGVYAYGPENYDATILVALAAIAADDDDSDAIKSKLIDVSKGGEKCTTFADCKALLEDGKDIDYDGVSGPIEWSDKGDPTEATIGIYQYGSDNTYTNLQFISGKL